MSEATPELSTLIREALESRLVDLHVAMPAKVLSYTAATKTCKVQPGVKVPVEDEDGNVTFEQLPPIENVPVWSPRSTGFSLTFALTPGDGVLLIFCESSPAGWRTTGQVSNPPDLRRHGFYPIALPGWFPDAQPAVDADDSIGKPGGMRVHFTAATVNVGAAADFVAMAAKVDAAITTLVTWAGTHTHAGVMAGGGVTGTAAPPTAPASTASVDLKAD